MRVESSKEIFQPIKIVLESQEEVNKLFAIFNYTPISEAVDIPSWWSELRPYKTDDATRFHGHLRAKIR